MWVISGFASLPITIATAFAEAGMLCVCHCNLCFCFRAISAGYLPLQAQIECSRVSEFVSICLRTDDAYKFVDMQVPQEGAPPCLDTVLDLPTLRLLTVPDHPTTLQQALVCHLTCCCLSCLALPWCIRNLATQQGDCCLPVPVPSFSCMSQALSLPPSVIPLGIVVSKLDAMYCWLAASFKPPLSMRVCQQTTPRLL